MSTIEIEGKVFEVDGDGFLSDPHIWNDEVAALIAKYDGIEEMNEKHWAIVRIIRQNWEEKGMAPMVRTICKGTGLNFVRFMNSFHWDLPEELVALPDYPNPTVASKHFEK